jgi:predicted lipoprotein with Yx(FWY)xxD motif
VKRFIPIAAIAAIAVVVIIAVSGGTSKNATSTAAAGAQPAAAGANSTIGTTSGKLGTYLVDAKGRTLYLFEADKPNMSTCSSACLNIWPALSANGRAPVAKGGVQSAKLGVTKAGNGKSIVTYNGHPLYYYAGDQKAGDTTGQGLDQFGAGWYVVTPAGSKIDNG